MSKMKQGQTEAVIDIRGRKRGLKVWIICPVCTEGRWVRTDSLKRKEFTGMCNLCHNKFTSLSGKDHGRWKGGYKRHGYFEVKVQPDSPFYPMSKKSGYLVEHRLVMAKSLGRCLESCETVHHLNGIKDDNRIENLQLISDRTGHSLSIGMQRELYNLRERIVQLEAQLSGLAK